MNIGIITTPNKKGQIVIPKKYRDALEIDDTVPLNLVLQEKAIFIYPVRKINESKVDNKAFLELLKKIKGSWADDKDWGKREKKRRKMELAASKRRKKEW